MANLSKIKREKMLKYLEKLKKINNDDENIRAITEIENALNEKKYGLVWEEHSEKIDEELIHNIPVFVEDEEIIITVYEKLPYKFLLEGDNLHSLNLLEKTHKGKIDVIYIDPPYNTGSNEENFNYDDNRVDKTDAFRHSKWLSFMYERLLIARDLLSDTGIIFISIDDNEQAQLRLLCDSLFGEDNFINQISVNAKVSAGASGGGEDKRLKKNIEYILLYSKKLSEFPPLNHIYKTTELMKYIEQMKADGKSYKYTNVLYRCENIIDYKTIKDGYGDDIKVKKVGNYEIKTIKQIAKEENLPEREVYYKYYDKVMTTTNAQTSIRTRVWEATDSLDNMYIATYAPKSGRNKGEVVDLIFMGKQKVLVIWLKDSSEKNKKMIYKKEKIGTYWDGFSWINVTKEGNIKFSNGKKPIDLIKQMMMLTDTKNSTILDYFAGSGTTGHAVMQLNKEDGGNRKYILCTNNENNICEEVTYQRLKNIQGELPHNLKYYKTDFIPKFSRTEENVSEKMMEHIRELIELEYAIELDGKKYIILDDEDKLDEIISKIENEGKLFVHSGIFLSRRNQRILEEKGVSIIEIPEYYFREDLKEVGEL